MKTTIWTDPIVDEIHEIRLELARKAGNDLDKFVERVQESQKQHADKLVTREQQQNDPK